MIFDLFNIFMELEMNLAVTLIVLVLGYGIGGADQAGQLGIKFLDLLMQILELQAYKYLDKKAHTKIQFNRKIKDSHNAFDTKNSRFVAPNDGMFLVGVGLYMINTPAYINFHLKLYLNGSLYKPIDHLEGGL